LSKLKAEIEVASKEIEMAEQERAEAEADGKEMLEKLAKQNNAAAVTSKKAAEMRKREVTALAKDKEAEEKAKTEANELGSELAEAGKAGYSGRGVDAIKKDVEKAAATEKKRQASLRKKAELREKTAKAVFGKERLEKQKAERIADEAKPHTDKIAKITALLEAAKQKKGEAEAGLRGAPAPPGC